MEHQRDLIKEQDVEIVSIGFAELLKTWVPTVLSVSALLITGVTAVVSLNYRVGSLETRFSRYEERQVQIDSTLAEIRADVRVMRNQLVIYTDEDDYSGGN